MRKSLNKYYNPNPRKHEVGDCVVRALCAAEEKDWDEIYSELCKIGFEVKAMPNDKETYREYLLRHGYVRTPISNKKGSKRPRVNDMAKESKSGPVTICEVAHHLVTVRDGAILDLCDSGECCLYGYWRK